MSYAQKDEAFDSGFEMPNDLDSYYQYLNTFGLALPETPGNETPGNPALPETPGGGTPGDIKDAEPLPDFGGWSAKKLKEIGGYAQQYAEQGIHISDANAKKIQKHVTDARFVYKDGNTDLAEYYLQLAWLTTRQAVQEAWDALQQMQQQFYPVVDDQYQYGNDAPFDEDNDDIPELPQNTLDFTGDTAEKLKEIGGYIQKYAVVNIHISDEDASEIQSKIKDANDLFLPSTPDLADQLLDEAMELAVAAVKRVLEAGDFEDPLQEQLNLNEDDDNDNDDDADDDDPPEPKYRPDTSVLKKVKPNLDTLLLAVDIPDLTNDEETVKKARDALLALDNDENEFVNDDFKGDLARIFEAADSDDELNKNLTYCMNKLPKDRLVAFATELTKLGANDDADNCGALLLGFAKSAAASFAVSIARQEAKGGDLPENQDPVVAVLQQGVQDKFADSLSSESFLDGIISDANLVSLEQNGVGIWSASEIGEYRIALENFYRQEGLLPGQPQQLDADEYESVNEEIESNRDYLIHTFQMASMKAADKAMRETIQESATKFICGWASAEEKRQAEAQLKKIAEANGTTLDKLGLFDVMDIIDIINDANALKDHIVKTMQTNFTTKMGAKAMAGLGLCSDKDPNVDNIEPPQLAEPPEPEDMLDAINRLLGRNNANNNADDSDDDNNDNED